MADIFKEAKQYTIAHTRMAPISIDFELPITVKLAVVDVDPGLRGDTVQGGPKPAVLDTGAVVNVPLFVDKGQEILVDTTSSQYMIGASKLS